MRGRTVISTIPRLAVAVFVVIATGATGAGQGRGGGFGGFGQERALVERFDADSNGRLDMDERRAARASLAGSQGGRRFGFGRRGGFGGRRFAATSTGDRVDAGDVQVFGNEPLYDPDVLRTIFLEFENADWEDELAAFYNTDVEVPAVATVDGRAYPDVGVHFRGASSFMMVPEGSKRSFNLSFDFVNDGQRLLGYRTLNLLNVNSDPTFVRAVFYSHAARQYLPAPKMNYVRVVVNGENWGVYVSAEQFNTDFTRDWFGATAGARWQVPGSPRGRGGMEYLGDDADAYRGIFDIRSRDREASWADLIDMFRVLDQTPADQLERDLGPLLDLDGVLRFLALEVAFVNSDGYWTRASDYSIYQDERGQFHVVRMTSTRRWPRGASLASAAGVEVVAARRARGPGPASTPSWASPTQASRCARSCWPCRRCGSGTSGTSVRSRRTGSTGNRWSRCSVSIGI